MTNAEKFEAMFGELPDRCLSACSWWDEEYVEPERLAEDQKGKWRQNDLKNIKSLTSSDNINTFNRIAFYATGGRQIIFDRDLTVDDWNHPDDPNVIRPRGAPPDQTAKGDAGKLRLTLVPRKIIKAIAIIREYGTQKYGDPDNWKRVEIERYRDAAFRHFMEYLDNPHGLDDESGLPHLWHLVTNIAFLCEMEDIEV